MFTSTCEINPILECASKPLFMERKWEPKIELAPNCPRCASSNTKFCYYNNYSFSQPRYFCKGCKRYWTKGGSLRNVPVGGGCRKSRRAKSAGGVGYARPGPSPSLSGNESENATSGAEIDLAAVFAKYLSQDSAGSEEIKAVNDQEASSGTCSGSLDNLLPLNSVSVDTNGSLEEFMFEYQKSSSELTDVLQFDEGLPQVSVGENFQDLLELHTMLGDHEIGQDMSWSDGTSLQNLAWQPIVQLEDFGSFSTDDDHNLKMSSNVVSSNNWSSSFDLSSYEIFSRP